MAADLEHCCFYKSFCLNILVSKDVHILCFVIDNNQLKHQEKTYLHSTVEEAAVLARLVQQSLGGGQRQHAPRLVRFPQIAPRLPEELHPCHWIVGSAFRQVGQSDEDRGGRGGRGLVLGSDPLAPWRSDFPKVRG